jgi:hypothetical protein
MEAGAGEFKGVHLCGDTRGRGEPNLDQFSALKNEILLHAVNNLQDRFPRSDMLDALQVKVDNILKIK